jgi:hypothetical protein
MVALAPGNWAEWFGAVAAALAFGTTSLAIWLQHRLRLREHAEALFDQALLVTTTTGAGTEYVTETAEDGTKERKPLTKIQVNLHNLSSRPITGVVVEAWSLAGTHIGHGVGNFVQAGAEPYWLWEPVGDAYAPFGSNPSVRSIVWLTFTDISGTVWVRHHDDRLEALPRSRWWHRVPAPEPPTFTVSDLGA